MGDVIKFKGKDNTKIKICSYRTWLKKNPNVQKYELWDGVKGWIRETINPTLKKNGWIECINEWDYGLFMNEKPKQMAIRLLKNTFGEEWMKDKEFVYNPYYYTGNNNFMDVLYIFYKKNRNINYGYNNKI